MSVPSPRVYVNGDTVSPVSGDNLNTFVQTFATAAQLRTLTGVSGMEIALQGISTVADGGQGNFYWNVSSTAADDNFSVFRPTGVTVGAWIRLPTAVASADVTLATVTVPGSTTARSLGERFGQVFDVLDYGAKCDGGTDDTVAVNKAILAASTAGGGTVVFPVGTCYMAGAFVIPYAGTASPTQAPIRLTGAGCIQNGYWAGVGQGGGTVINNTYVPSGSVIAKIDTRGAGVLVIDNLTLTDTGTGGGLFIQTTNTILILRDMTIAGYAGHSGTACVQNGVRLGGVTSGSLVLGTSAATAGFQGYGTRLDNVYFEHLNQCVTYGGSANATVMSNCTVSGTCGSGDTHGAPYVLVGQGYGAEGNIWLGGIVETTHYPHAVAMLDDGTGTAVNKQNSFFGLGIYDESVGTPTLSMFYFSTYSEYNSVYMGYGDGNPATFTGPSAAKNNIFGNGGVPSSVSGQFTAIGGLTSGSGIFTGTGDYAGLYSSAGAGGLLIHAPSGATTLFVNSGASSTTLTPTATNASLAVSPNGTGRLGLGTTGSTLGFFDGVGATKGTVTGSRGGNAALASLLTLLQSYGILTDSST